jgi:hypothetical protein
MKETSLPDGPKGKLHDWLSEGNTQRMADELLIALIMEAVRTSETSVNLNVTTRLYIP